MKLCAGRTVGCLTVLLLLALSAPAPAKTWHVSQRTLAGIDSRLQVTTIGDAILQVQPGDTVLLHAGVYRESVTVEKSGTADQPITLRSAEGEYVVLTGADRLVDWSVISGDEAVYYTSWPHKFVAWTKSYTHPSDDYHRLIGRCEQVLINGYLLRQVLDRDTLCRGTFYVDMDAQRLYVQPADNQDIAQGKAMVEASTRGQILSVQGSHVVIKGMRFRYAANRAQHGAVQLAGDHIRVEDCVFEHTNSSGASFTGQDIVASNCTFQHNGQLGFGASRAHRLRMTGCTVRNNNTKGFDRGWEAGGDKICLTRAAVLEHCVFADNRGDGVWFDIGNEDCEVHNCLIMNNENAGIFYEISYGLHAHDNVIIGNGFAGTPGAWGAAAGISLSSSPGCTIQRNLLLGNKEGFNFREQLRSTPRIDRRGSEPVWNHHQIIRQNVIAFNRDAQVWGWFDVADQRHWPTSMQTPREDRPPAEESSDQPPAQLTGLSLEKLHLAFEGNLYCPGLGQDLFNWGVTWKKHHRYATLDQLRRDLSLDQRGEVAELHFEDYHGLDFRVPENSPAVRKDCYPHGEVPHVRLGITGTNTSSKNSKNSSHTTTAGTLGG